MIPVINASKVYSVLGNNNSLVPLAIKDIANSIGLTAGSYAIGDKAEGQDRFIDEFGTQALWLFGIPTYKKVLDATLFKSMGYDHKVDVRVLKNKDIFEKAKQFAQDEKVKSSFEKIGKNQKTFKGLTFAKFAISTLLTIGTYGALTHYRHKYTEDSIRKNILEQNKKQKVNKAKLKQESTFTSLKTQKSEAFKGVSLKNKNENKNGEQVNFSGGMSDFMFSPVKNLMLLDGAITGERLGTSRSVQDFLGYSIKEGSFWIFMYGAGQKIQEYLEKTTEQKHNKSIDLDARVIESEELKNAFKDNSLTKSIKEVAKAKNDVELYEFINKNPDNFVVKMAKKSGVVQTICSNENMFVKFARRTGMLSKLEHPEVVDTRAYIDLDEFKGVSTKLEKLHNQYKSSGEDLDTFLNGVKKLKRGSVWKNMGACIFALGVLTPAIMVATRYIRKDKNFEVEEKIKKELAFEGELDKNA